MDEPVDIEMQETATFQAMNNDMILSCLCDAISSSGKLSGLLPVLARTSRLCFRPAVKAIWREIRTILPLVRTMPPDCWEVSTPQTENPSGNPVRHLRFRRPITTRDCERFRLYASFVRRFFSFYQKPSQGTLTIDPNIFHFLSATFRKHFSTIKILPSLDFLSWNVKDDLEFPHFIMFVNRHLREIILDISGPPFVRLAIIGNLFSFCPNLQSIELCHSEEADTVSVISHTFPKFPKLRTLDIGAVSKEAFVELARHPQLTQLSLTFIDGIDWDSISDQLQMEPTFQTLERMRISRAVENDCLQLLKTVHPPLNDILLHLEACTTGSSYSHLLATLRDQCSVQGSLKDITLRSLIDEPEPGTLPPAPGVDPLVSAHLSPLLTFHHLTYIEIRPFCFITVDNAWIKQAAEALPKIERFTLFSESSSPNSNHPIKITLHGLVHFALNCPALEYLALEFDARHPSFPDKVSRDPRLHRTSLATLCVGYSLITDKYTVAAIFSDWFPKLSLIHSGKLEAEADEDMQAAWNEVRNLIPRIRDIRRQERASLKRRREVTPPAEDTPVEQDSNMQVDE